MQYPLPIILTVLGTILFSASGLPRRGLAAEAAGRESRPAAEFHAYVVSHTHSDFAWLDSIAACLDKNVAAVAKSVEIAERYPDFRFCMEHMLACRAVLAPPSGEDRDRAKTDGARAASRRADSSPAPGN